MCYPDREWLRKQLEKEAAYLFRNATNLRISFGLIEEGDAFVRTRKDELSDYDVQHYAREAKNKLVKQLKIGH